MRDYQGTRVVCTLRHWRQKVEANHPELVGLAGEVASILETPDIVLQDRDYRALRHHIRRTGEQRYTAAVVEYGYVDNEVAMGRLVTAFVRRRLRAGDRALYQREDARR